MIALQRPPTGHDATRTTYRASALEGRHGHISVGSPLSRPTAAQVAAEAMATAALSPPPTARSPCISPTAKDSRALVEAAQLRRMGGGPAFVTSTSILADALGVDERHAAAMEHKATSVRSDTAGAGRPRLRSRAAAVQPGQRQRVHRRASQQG